MRKMPPLHLASLKLDLDSPKLPSSYSDPLELARVEASAREAFGEKISGLVAIELLMRDHFYVLTGDYRKLEILIEIVENSDWGDLLPTSDHKKGATKLVNRMKDILSRIKAQDKTKAS